MLDKIRCVYAIEYDRATNAPKVLSYAPVFDATQPLHVSIKQDGECCWFQAETGVPMRRRDIKNGKAPPPPDWVRTGEPDNNGHTIGFIPIETDKAAKYMWEALDYKQKDALILSIATCKRREACHSPSWLARRLSSWGPRVQGNPSKLAVHCFAIHGEVEVPQADIPLASYASTCASTHVCV